MAGVFSRLVGQGAVEAELVAAAQAARGDPRSQCERHRDHDTCVADYRPARVRAFGGCAVFRGRAAVHIRRRARVRGVPRLHHDDGGHPRRRVRS